MIRFVLGLIGTIIFALLLTATLIFSAFPGIGLDYTPVIIVSAALLAACLIVMHTGLVHRNTIMRLSKYSATLLHKANVMPIDNLAYELGIKPSTIRGDMRRMQKKNLKFDIYMDRTETTLMQGESSYTDYLDNEKKREELAREEAERKARLENPETQPLESFLVEGRAMLEKIRAANVLLPGDEISNTLYKLECTAQRIFAYIENHPEKLQDTRKLMNYHLPTTLKLIENYCRYDAMEYQPENVSLAKRDIEKALTSANEAFTNFLHSLYDEDTLDVVTEAEVLQKMFEKDGLVGAKFDIDMNDNNPNNGRLN